MCEIGINAIPSPGVGLRRGVMRRTRGDTLAVTVSSRTTGRNDRHLSALPAQRTNMELDVGAEPSPAVWNLSLQT
jgi:hypothetical protein